MLPAVGCGLVRPLVGLSFHEKGSAEGERRFAVIYSNQAFLKRAVVRMKLTLLEIECPVAREIRALLHSRRDTGGCSDGY